MRSLSVIYAVRRLLICYSLINEYDDDKRLYNPKSFLCVLMMILNPSFCSSILWFFGDDIPYVPNKKGNNNISHYHHHHTLSSSYIITIIIIIITIHYHHHTSSLSSLSSSYIITIIIIIIIMTLGGGVCIGNKIAPIFYNTMEDSGALPLEMSVDKMYTGTVRSY